MIIKTFKPNTMKNLFTILSAALLLSSFGCQSDKKANDNPETFLSPTSTTGFVVTNATRLRASDTKIQEYISMTKGKNGKIDTKVATAKLAAFKFWADIEDNGSSDGSVDFKTAHYGHLFDFDYLYKYLDSLKTVNDNTTDPELLIDGIRIYMGATYYADGFIPEVFLFPTQNNLNIKDIDEDYPSYFMDKSQEEILEEIKNFKTFGGDGSGYNASLPCPQSCP